MSDFYTKSDTIRDLTSLGVMPGDTILVHSSYKALGCIIGGAKTIFEAFFELLGPDGTLIFPALSYETVTRENPVFDIGKTPSCVGYLTEYFRTEVPGVIRSLHPTHSCCAKGKRAEEICRGHELDNTPVGKNSPFARLPQYKGKILFLGCSTNSNTSMHGVEETVKLPYGMDWENPVEYVLNTASGTFINKMYRHNFWVGEKHIDQRYGRIENLLSVGEIFKGKVLSAHAVLMDADAVWKKGHEKLLSEPYYFVDHPDMSK